MEEGGRKKAEMNIQIRVKSYSAIFLMALCLGAGIELGGVMFKVIFNLARILLFGLGKT